MIHTHAIAAALLTLTLGISPQIAAPSDLMGQQVAALQFHDTVLLQNTVHAPVTGTYDVQVLKTIDNTSRGWGQGTNFDEKNRPKGALNAQNTYGGYDALYIAEESPAIYLTIDEGYENGYTAKILDVLKEKNCPAVFFVTMDYVKQNPDLIQRMIDEGHVVGNHSVTHPAAGLPSQSIDTQAEELMALHRYVKETFDYDMYLFRYPAGIHSDQSLALVQQLGYKSVFWSFAYRDWITDDQPDPAAALQQVTNRLHPGAIYLLHAVSSTNTQIMGDFIDHVRAQGYTFAKMK
jgi:peptidoglycan-N-acetylmuramic acid deacetylase